MSSMTSGPWSGSSQQAGEAERRRRHLAEWERGRRGPSPGLMLLGMVAVGLGGWALYHFGPDLVRYMKIRNM